MTRPYKYTCQKNGILALVFVGAILGLPDFGQSKSYSYRKISL